jgi:hypothetical protein
VNLPIFMPAKNLTAVLDRSPYGHDSLEEIAGLYGLVSCCRISRDVAPTSLWPLVNCLLPVHFVPAGICHNSPRHERDGRK